MKLLFDRLSRRTTICEAEQVTGLPEVVIQRLIDSGKIPHRIDQRDGEEVVTFARLHLFLWMTSGSAGEFKARPSSVPIASISQSMTYQLRARIRDSLVTDYSARMKVGVRFPAVWLARVDGTLFVVDGFHRVLAASRIGCSEILAFVLDCDAEEAFALAVVANEAHGLQKAPIDRKQVAVKMLQDRQFSDLSCEDLGKIVGVSAMSIWRYRREMITGQKPTKRSQDIKTGNVEWVTAEIRNLLSLIRARYVAESYEIEAVLNRIHPKS